MRRPVPILLLFLAALPGQKTNLSGGALDPAQAAFDVRHVDLALTLRPVEREIEGVCTLTVEILAPIDRLLLDLDPALELRGAREGEHALPATREEGRLGIGLGRERPAGETVRVAIAYGGRPRRAPLPPWRGGFTFSETPSGAPWIATSCQGEGADLWWPCKDHPSDEPESADLRFTVPRGLVAASNGRLVATEEGPETTTFHWHVSTPINNYGIALCVAPYVEVRATARSVAGGEFPVVFFALPESEEKAQALLPEILDHLRFFEEHFGPYPFRADKYGVAETPFLGMEHQSLIAYGYGFARDPMGYDWLHHHELSHEWFGNLVTCSDWKDFWLHEGLGTYSQALYIETKHGLEGYLREMRKYRAMVVGRRVLAPREPRTTAAMSGDNDIYMKGACVLHALRFLIGKEALLAGLRRYVYPDPALEASTDGRACRFATTEDLRSALETAAGRDLGWFFEVYVRSSGLPRLVEEREPGRLGLRWELPSGLAFPMPVPVRLGEELRRVEMPEGHADLVLPEGAEVVVDPEGWVLRAGGPRRGG